MESNWLLQSRKRAILHDSQRLIGILHLLDLESNGSNSKIIDMDGIDDHVSRHGLEYQEAILRLVASSICPY